MQTPSTLHPFIILAFYSGILSQLEHYAQLLNDGRPTRCSHCGSFQIWKNGTYTVTDWRRFFLFRWFLGKKAVIQRYICGQCRSDVCSSDREEQRVYRQKARLLLKRTIAFARFGLNLSCRKIQELVRFVYNKPVSLGFVNQTIQAAGEKAQAFLGVLNHLKASVKSVVVMVDETFIKIKNKTRSALLAIDEHGLIRLVKVMTKRKADDVEKEVSAIETEYYKPLYYLRDFAKNLLGVFKNAKSYFDIVHAHRIIHRLFEQAIRDSTKDTPKKANLTRNQRKAQIKLKRRLLRKRFAFSRMLLRCALQIKDHAIAAVLIEAALLRLENLNIEAAQNLKKQLRKFFDKYQQTLFEMLENPDIPHTTNLLEATCGIIKDSAKNAEHYQSTKSAQRNLAGVALFRNFKIAIRGRFKDTSPIQRAGVQTDKKDFLEAIELV